MTWYRDVVLADSPTIYWPLDENDGGWVRNLGTAGPDFDGQIFGAVLTADGPDGRGAAHLDGVDDYIEAPVEVSDSDMLGGETMEVWVFATQFPTGSPPSMEAARSGDTEALGRSGELRMTIGGVIIFGGASTGRWYHLVATRNLRDMTFWVDGIEVGTRTTNLTVAGGILAVGKGRSNRRFWDGQVGELALYDYALTEAQIVAHFEAGPPPPTEDHVGGSSATVVATATATGSGHETAVGGAAGWPIRVDAYADGHAVEHTTGGSAVTVGAVTTGTGTATEQAGGGTAVTLTATAAGVGHGQEHAAGGSAAAVGITASGAGGTTVAVTGGSAAILGLVTVTTGTGTEHTAGGTAVALAVTATTAGVAGEHVTGGTAAVLYLAAAGAGWRPVHAPAHRTYLVPHEPRIYEVTP